MSQQQGMNRRGKKKTRKQGERSPPEVTEETHVVVHKLGDDAQECFVCREDMSNIRGDQRITHHGKTYHRPCYESEKGEVAPGMLGEKFGPSVQGGRSYAAAAKEAVSDKYESAKEATQQVATDTIEGAQIGIQHAKETAGVIADDVSKRAEGVKETIGETLQSAQEKAGAVVADVSKRAEGVKETIGETIHSAQERIGDTVHAAQAKAVEYKDEAAKQLAELQAKAGEVIGGAREHMTQVVGQTVEGAREGVHYVTTEVPAKLIELKHQAEETVSEVKESVTNKAEDIQEVTGATLGEMGETVGETVDMIKDKTYHVKEAAEENVMYAKESVSSKLHDMQDSFLQFKENYDTFKAEAAKGHGISLFDKAATAVSDLTAWLSGEIEEEEEESVVYQGTGGDVGMGAGMGAGRGRGTEFQFQSQQQQQQIGSGLQQGEVGYSSVSLKSGKNY